MKKQLQIIQKFYQLIQTIHMLYIIEEFVMKELVCIEMLLKIFHKS